MEFLKKLLEKILSLFPEVRILSPYEAGIRITFGKRVKVKGAGWYVFWPLIQRFEWMEVQSQVVDLRNQSLRTADGYNIVISGAVQYKITDIEKAFVNIQDVDKAIETLALGIIVDFICKKNLADCQDAESLKTEILKGLREAARGWGLKIEKIFITDFGKTRNIRLLTNTKPEIIAEE